MRHVGDPGHRSFVEGRRGQGGLGSLERQTGLVSSRPRGHFGSAADVTT